LIGLNKTRTGTEEAKRTASPYDISLETPYDSLIPLVDDLAVQFYLDAMRIYLGLCAGSITMETALKAVARLKENSEYTISPTNPTLIPISEKYRVKMIENLNTLKKFNLFTLSAIRSAFNFVFLIEDAPISETDFAVLSALGKNPIISLVDASSIINLAPRTIARSLERLHERNSLRISCLIDYAAFNLQSLMVFFTLQKGIEWESIERGIIQYPFTKSILRTAMTDVGYVTFLIPNYNENMPLFIQSIRTIAKSIFDYSSIHIQTQSGATSNIALFNNDSWGLPENLENLFKTDQIINAEDYPPLLNSTDPKSGFTQDDFIIAAEMQLDARAPPSKISEGLRMRGINIDPKKISTIIRKLQNHNLSLPYLMFAIPKLSSNFCFEIICNDEWKSRILLTIKKFPWVMYYLSSRGIIVWTMTSGEHQVEYYQLIRALEQKPGVSSVQPIMTISQSGSKSMLDITRDLTFIDGRWSIGPESLDIGDYIEY
jgi:DNA-binding Lrp family transcriptional regulator